MSKIKSSSLLNVHFLFRSRSFSSVKAPCTNILESGMHSKGFFLMLNRQFLARQFEQIDESIQQHVPIELDFIYVNAYFNEPQFIICKLLFLFYVYIYI
jgi:hypothetical protein